MSGGFLNVTAYFDVLLPVSNPTWLTHQHMSVLRACVCPAKGAINFFVDVTSHTFVRTWVPVCWQILILYLKLKNYFFLLTSNFKSVFRYGTSEQFKWKGVIFLLKLQIKGFYIWKKLQQAPASSVDTPPTYHRVQNLLHALKCRRSPSNTDDPSKHAHVWRRDGYLGEAWGPLQGSPR